MRNASLFVRVVQKCLALIGTAVTVISVVLFAVTDREWAAWIAIGGLLAIIISMYLVLREEHAARIKAESERTEVRPPGHRVAFMAPVEYQVNALRQVIAKMTEAGMTEFEYFDLDLMVQKLPRTGTDEVYEPLRGPSCDAGLNQLIALGELQRTKRGGWRIM
jgi:hypothetical protein